MADQKITALPAGLFPNDSDLFVSVDVSDHTMSGAGSDVKMTLNTHRLWLRTYLQDREQIVIPVPGATNYTPSTADSGSLVTMNSPTDVNFNLPDNAHVALSVGTSFDIIQLGVGHIFFVPQGGIAAYKTSTQGSRAKAQLVATDVWALSGSLVTA